MPRGRTPFRGAPGARGGYSTKRGANKLTRAERRAWSSFKRGKEGKASSTERGGEKAAKKKGYYRKEGALLQDTKKSDSG